MQSARLGGLPRFGDVRGSIWVSTEKGPDYPAFFFVWKNILGKYWALKTDEKDFRSTAEIHDGLVGAEGLAESMLRPSGIARLNDRRHDVVTRGEMIEKGARIKVIEVSGNRIVVKKV